FSPTPLHSADRRWWLPRGRRGARRTALSHRANAKAEFQELSHRLRPFREPQSHLRLHSDARNLYDPCRFTPNDFEHEDGGIRTHRSPNFGLIEDCELLRTTEDQALSPQ